MSMTSKVTMAVTAALVNAIDVGRVEYNPSYSKVFNLSNGAGADQANMIWTETRTLTASSSENIDLAGSLSDAFGNTITFTKLKGIMVVAAGGNTNSVNVTRPTSNGVPLFLAASDGIGLTPGSAFSAVFPDANGIAVTADTGDLITITNSAGSTSVTYTIVLIGTV